MTTYSGTRDMRAMMEAPVRRDVPDPQKPLEQKGESQRAAEGQRTSGARGNRSAGDKRKNHEKGGFFEEAAAEYLQKQNYQILDRNYRFHRNEIDIIAREGNTYVFVEVKARLRRDRGYGYQAVDYRKQQAIRQVAQDYLFRHKLSFYDTPCRFDVISIDGGQLLHIKNAF